MNQRKKKQNKLNHITDLHMHLLYASQTWSLTTKHKNTIEVCQRKMARKILGVSTKDRISNTQLQEWSMLKSAAQQASRTK